MLKHPRADREAYDRLERLRSLTEPARTNTVIRHTQTRHDRGGTNRATMLLDGGLAE